MITLLNVALAGGLAVAAVPVAVHLLHRRKFQRVEWGAMRFLAELMRRRKRRLNVEDLLLLAVRAAALACLALALARPLVQWSGRMGGDTVLRSGKVAAVLLIDDGFSSAVGRSASALDEEKRLALAYLDTLRTGAEVSVIPFSRLAAPAADPLYDLDAARSVVQAVTATAVAADIPAALQAGLDRLARHLNPAAEIVLITDGRAQGWHASDRVRWDDLRSRFAVASGRLKPELVLLAPTAAAVDGNLAVTGVRIDRAVIPAGRPVTVRVTVTLGGQRPVPGVVVRLLLDGRPVAEKALDCTPGGSSELVFTQAFPLGSHAVTAAVEGHRDPMPLDDRRTVQVHAEDHIDVLLVEGVPGTGIDGSLGLVAAALDPVGDNADLFRTTRITAPALTAEVLAKARVAVLGDLPALDTVAVAALERFIVGGGGVLAVLGTHGEADLIRRTWHRGGAGFLPCAPLGISEPAEPAQPGLMDLGHPALSAFSARHAAAWSGVQVRRWQRLDVAKADVARLVSLAGGDPLVVEGQRGFGRVAVVATALDGSTTDLPMRPAFVPLMRGLVASLGAELLPPRNLRPGERLAWIRPDDAPATLVPTASDPEGAPLPLTEGAWEGRRALVSEPLARIGAYQITADAQQIRYAVAPDPTLSTLEVLDRSVVGQVLAGVRVASAQDAAQVAALFADDRSGGIEIGRWLVMACLALLFAESLIAARRVLAERTAQREAGL